MRIALIALSSLLAGACGSEAEELPPEPVEIAGTWREHFAGPFDMQDRIEIRPDRTITSDLHGEGQYVVADKIITVTYADGGFSSGFARGADVLLFDALRPVGEVDGVIGTWSGRIRETGAQATTTTDMTLTVRSDGTGRLEVSPSLGPPTEGTWALDGGDILEVEGVGAFMVVPGRALGRGFDRVP